YAMVTAVGQKRGGDYQGRGTADDPGGSGTPPLPGPDRAESAELAQGGSSGGPGAGAEGREERGAGVDRRCRRCGVLGPRGGVGGGNRGGGQAGARPDGGAAAEGGQGDQQLDWHEAGLDPERQFQDGLARHGQGRLRRRKATTRR